MSLVLFITVNLLVKSGSKYIKYHRRRYFTWRIEPVPHEVGMSDCCSTRPPATFNQLGVMCHFCVRSKTF